MKEELFLVKRGENYWEFKNDSPYNLVISLIPINPKRKVIDIIIVARDSYKIFEEDQIDIFKCFFRWENPK